jgi:hypothetical protein
MSRQKAARTAGKKETGFAGKLFSGAPIFGRG